MNKRSLDSSSSEGTSSKYFKSRGARLSLEDFDKDCLLLSKQLLGKVLCRKIEGSVLKGLIVETESYPGFADVASHSYQGKKTRRNGAMFLRSGTAYVYKIYGMYHCFNISSKEEGSAVLIRALDPVFGQEKMKELRSKKRKDRGLKLKEKDFCSGPSKLCESLNISKEEINEADLTESALIWLEDGEEVSAENIVTTTRIGIEGAGQESAQKPYRFYVLGNKNVSVRDRVEEKKMQSNNTESQLVTD